MRILFEGQSYSPEILESFGLDSYAFTSRDRSDSVLPYVGYIYSPKINDAVFILPKVFLFEGSGKIDKKENLFHIAFGKYEIEDVMNITADHNPLKKDGLAKVIFGLSTWIYRAIDRYSQRHPRSEIIRRADIRRVSSDKGDDNQTLLDIILSLIAFHKDHADLFTYISIINASGNNKIHWGKTISKVQPIIQDNIPSYAEFRNKSKTINCDEELIVLFYSVLEYLRNKYFFPLHPNLNYDLLKPSKIESMIESGRGTKLLRSIRRKYFKDELVLLWKLLYAFFDKAEAMRSGKCHEEALLAGKFDRVFEDMVDCLVSDDEFAALKKNEDGKEIDHIYKDRSLVDNSLIYYIGDSKYYSYASDVMGESRYKQFTYAKNIIQLNINIFNKPENEREIDECKIINEIRYRDSLTEGYNPTPNFFIRGRIMPEDLADGHACYSEDRLAESKQVIDPSLHFKNRPFDRDTLILQSYDINFLFLLAAYIENQETSTFKSRIRETIHQDLIQLYNKCYDFFKVTPAGDKEDFVKRNFRKYVGNMYSPENSSFIWFAFDKKTTSQDTLQQALGVTAEVKASPLT